MIILQNITVFCISKYYSDNQKVTVEVHFFMIIQNALTTLLCMPLQS